MTQLLAFADTTDASLTSDSDPISRVVSPESGIAPRAHYVLLVDTTGERLAWMEGAVSDGHECLTARSKEEAIFLMQAQSVDLILADSEACSTDFLTAVATRGLSRFCVFLANATEMERLSEAYAAQHTFRVLSSDHSIDTVRSFLHGLLYPREEARRLLPDIRAELSAVGHAPLSCAVLDLSNRGVAVRLEAGQELPLPGTRLTQVTLYRNGERLLDEVGAVVRYVEVLAPGDAGGVAYKLGLELRAPVARLETEGTVLTEPTLILAALKVGLGRGTLSVALADAKNLVASSRNATVDASAGEILVETAPRFALERGDVVECRFEVSGASYSFVASVSRPLTDDRSGFALRMPRALRSVKQRRSARFEPPVDSPVTVLPSSPFTGRSQARRAVNVTGSGAAFPISSKGELLPIGTCIPNIELRFPDGTEIACRAAVRTLVPGAEPGEMICGVEFVGLSRVEQQRIANSIVNAGRPEFRDGSTTSFDAIWSLLLKSKFLYPEKLATLDQEAIRPMMTRLLAQSNDVLKTTVLVVDGQVEGHVSGVHAYRKTISLQHLAALVNSKVTMTRGRLLSVAIVEYLEQLPDIEWVKIWYRPKNPWPARHYHAYANKLAEPWLSHNKTYTFAVSPTDVPYVADSGITVRPATALDYARIEGHFVAAREAVLLRSDDLTSAHLPLTQLSETYRDLGLERRREIFIAERNGEFAGFALLEVSSMGLNFSELTNAFRVYATIGDDANAERTRRALVARARERYRELGRDRAIGLAAPVDLSAFQVHGFEARKDYACWTWHRSKSHDIMRHLSKVEL